MCQNQNYNADKFADVSQFHKEYFMKLRRSLALLWPQKCVTNAKSEVFQVQYWPSYKAVDNEALRGDCYVLMRRHPLARLQVFRK